MFMFVFFFAIAMSVVTESCPTSSVPTVKTSSSSFEIHVILFLVKYSSVAMGAPNLVFSVYFCLCIDTLAALTVLISLLG